jgi:hypothetical protein
MAKVELEGVGSQWSRSDNTYCSPDAKNAGPNQILLLEDIFFKNGTIEAIVTAAEIQPDHVSVDDEPGKLECGLVGRYQSPACYITGGIGGGGVDGYYIAEVAAGRFRVVSPLEDERLCLLHIEQDVTRRLRLVFAGDEISLYDDTEGMSGEPVRRGKTAIVRGGRCGLRADWTESYFDEVKAQSSDSKECFVIAPMGHAGSPIRYRSDRVLQRIILPVLADFGYRAERADQMAFHGEIAQKMIECLKSKQLVVADLTEHNPNVFYELATRHAAGLPCIQLIERGDQLPFDVQGLQIVEIDFSTREGVERAKNRMRDLVAKIDLPIAKTDSANRSS